MIVKLSVLLYSNYSPKSKQIMQLIQNCGFDFVAATQLVFFSIDNENIRRRILANKQIQISSVPCILIVYDDGGVEKYEGATCFRWINEIIQKNLPPLPPPPPPPPPPQPQPTPFMPQDQYYEENLPLPPPPPPPQPPQPPQPQHQPPPHKESRAPNKSKTGITNLEDLPNIEEEEEENEPTPVSNIKRYPIGIRSNAGNYEIMEPEGFKSEFTDVIAEESANRKVGRGIKNSTDKNEKKDIMTLAQAMQKDRDKEVEKMGPPPIV